MGLVSPGGVHSNPGARRCPRRHWRGAAGSTRVWFHAFTDGRDEPPSQRGGFLRRFTDVSPHVGSSGRLATVAGALLRHGPRHALGSHPSAPTKLIVGDGGAVAFVDAGERTSRRQYDRGVTDEFIEPAAIFAHGGDRVRIEDGDSIIFFNFRPDRARQLSHALVDPGFSAFTRSRVLEHIDLVTFTEYERDLAAEVAFTRQDVSHTLAEEVSAAGLRQFHVAETEKHAHVTYFINGGREAAFEGEERLLVPSQRVPTYDTTPEMSAVAITDSVVEHVERGDDALIVLNFANPDMVGHTGVFEATVRAVEVVDGCLDRIERAVLAAGGGLLITADHGNAELKIDVRDNSPLTAHTTSPVPVILCGTDASSLREGGGLADIAPTVLTAMGLEVPDEMTGRSLA